MSGVRNQDLNLQAQVNALTSALSLMRSPSNNYTSLTMASPSNAASASDPVLGRLREMEDRQHWLENLIGGVGGSNSELEEIRAKRLALEERQLILEQELLQWKRKLKNEESAPSMKGKGKSIVKNVCGGCEKLKGEKLKIANLEAEFRMRCNELKLERDQIGHERAVLESEKRALEETRRKISEQAKSLQTLRNSNQQQILKQVCPSCEMKPRIQLLEETLCRNLNELGKEKAALEGDKAWVDCVKRDLEKSRHQIQEQRKAIEAEKINLENRRKALESERREALPSTSSYDHSSTINIERLRQRELENAKKSQEFEVLKYEIEKKQQELTAGRRELEQSFEHLFEVQKSLEKEKKEIERNKFSASALAEKAKELHVEKEKLELFKNKLMKEKEELNRRNLEIETNFNLLELQMRAISGAEHSQRNARIRQEVFNPEPQVRDFSVTSDRQPLLEPRTSNRR